jgi:prepilin-type processing-associated H-X9-DG protein
VNNVKQIALGMHNFVATSNRFPAAAINDSDGKPLLSWRVAILPYINEEALYRKFKLDEPWDSPHNLPLLAEMPKVFICPSDPVGEAKTTTRYQVIAGPGTLFDGPEGFRIEDVVDGTANTLLVVESRTPVPWTKPEDIDYDPTAGPPTLGSNHPGGVNAAFADGSVRFIKNSINPGLLRSLVTRNGGEVVPADF